MKTRFDISKLSQEQFEIVLNALIMLKQSNPKMDVYLNESFIIKIIHEMNKYKNE